MQAEGQQKVVLSPEYVYNRLTTFFISTFLILISLSYTVFAAKQFGEDLIIIILFLGGFVGYLILSMSMIRYYLREVPGKLNIYYRRHDQFYDYLITAFFIIVALIVQYVIFGGNSLLPISGEIIMIIIGFALHYINKKKR